MIKKDNVSYSDPGAGSDAASGYSVGSRWLNVQTGREFFCIDSTAGAAKWAPASVGYGFTSGTYKLPEYITAVSDGQPTGGTMVFLPLIVREQMLVDQIGISLTTAQSGAKCRLAVYYGVDGQPGYLRSDLGELDLSSGSGLKTVSTSMTMTPGLYFLAGIFNSPTTQPTVKRVSGAHFGAISFGGGGDITGGTPGRYWSAASQTYGAYPSAAPPVVGDSGTAGVAIFVRKA